MKRMTRIKLTIMMVVGLAGLSLAMGIFFFSHNKETLKIGVIIPLSGPASQHTVVANAIRLATEEVNASGGINGRQVEVIIRDSKSDKQEGIKAFHGIERRHKPLLYISTTSSVSLALAPLAEQNKVVLVGLVVAAPVFTYQKKWVFRYYVSPEQETMPIMTILRKLDVRSLGILFQDDEFGASHMETLKDGFEKTGGRVIASSFKPRTTDFTAEVSLLRETDAVYIAGFVNAVGQVIKQFRENHYEGFLLSHSGSTSLPRSMPELDDIYVAAPIIYNPNYVFAREAKARYESRYDQFFTHQAANGYDFIKILAGLMKGQTVSRSTIRTLLEDKFSYPGIFGYIEKKEGAHDIYFPLYPARIVHGEIVYLQ